MNVLLTVPSLERGFGGPTWKAFQLAGSLARLHSGVALVGCGESLEGATGLGRVGAFHTTPIPRTLTPLRKHLSVTEVVHIFGYRDPVGTAAAFYSLRRGVPYVLEPTGMYSAKVRSYRLKATYEAIIGRRIVAGASAIVVNSEIEAEEIRVSGAEKRLFIRPNGISMEPRPSTRSHWRSRLGVPEDSPLVLFLGRITRKKRPEDLVSAVERLPDVWAALCGPIERDGTIERLKATVETSSARGRIVIHPFGVWGSDKRSLLEESDCFCLPSETENFGNLPAEAAALGIPVVVSDRCGVAEFLPPQLGKTFILGNVAELASSLRAALRMGRRSEADPVVRRFVASLEWDTLASRQLEIYRNIISAHR